MTEHTCADAHRNLFERGGCGDAPYHVRWRTADRPQTYASLRLPQSRLIMPQRA